MHSHIRLKRARLSRGQCPDIQLSHVLFDPYRFGSEMNVNAKVASSLNQLINEIRVKKGKRTRATVEDCDLRSRKRGYMRKLKRDIAASDKENPPREFIQLQELIACRKVLSPGNPQVCRNLPGRDNDVPSLQRLLSYLYCSGTGEARPTMERRDTGFCESVFAPFWNRPGERTLETHQLGPINLKLRGLNSFSFHSTSPVNGFGSADEHFLWVASP
jgi:hypothetical protein